MKDMKIKLKSFSFEGIKNIESKLEINFINKKKVYNKDVEKANITAIYGPNGSGKSAFVEAVMLYKEISIKKSCLLQHNEYIKEYKNDNCEHIILEAAFNITSDTYNIAEEIIHTIKIDKNLEIVYEKIQNKSRKIEIINGEFSSSNIIKKKTQSRFINLLKDSSLVSLVIPYLLEDELDLGTFKKTISMLADAVTSIRIFIEDKDDNFAQMYLRKNKIKDKESIESILSQNLKRQINIININVVSSKEKKSFENFWNKIGEFIKIIKPQVKGIKIQYDNISADKLKPTVFLDYGKCQINILSESVGILKLINMYDDLHNLVNKSSILIIDEFDAHLHDVLINEILQYIIANEEGQLIFTTHNVLLMERLKFQKGSIQFLDLEGNIHHWSRNGNSSPEKAYMSGLITNDFKYGIFDFDEVLSDE